MNNKKELIDTKDNGKKDLKDLDEEFYGKLVSRFYNIKGTDLNNNCLYQNRKKIWKNKNIIYLDFLKEHEGKLSVITRSMYSSFKDLYLYNKFEINKTVLNDLQEMISKTDLKNAVNNFYMSKEQIKFILKNELSKTSNLLLKNFKRKDDIEMNNKKELINTKDEFEIDDEFIKGYEEFLQELEIFQKLEKNRKEQKDYERDK